MTTRFLAKAASFTDDGECTILAFADDPNQPVNYVTLQISNEPKKEELAYGWRGVHIEAGALHIDGYDLVQSICETHNGIMVKIIAAAAEQAGIGTNIEIELKNKSLQGISMGEALQRFKDRLTA